MDFQKEVIEESRIQPVLVDFWAEWCAPCRMLGPVVEKLANASGGKWKLVKVNVEEEQALATEYGIRGIPNLKLFHQGEVIAELGGALPEGALKSWIEQHLPTKSKMLVKEAHELLSGGDLEAALEKVDAAISEDPGYDEAKILKANLLLFEDPATAAMLAAEYKPGDIYYPLASSIHTLAVWMQADPDTQPGGRAREDFITGLRALQAGDQDQALSRLIDSMMAELSYQDEAAKKIVVALFQLLGQEHPLALKYRRKFGMALA